MTTTNFNTANSLGINFETVYTAYDQTAAISSTNSPDNPGPPFTLGTTVKGSKDSDFVFVKATTAFAAADVVQIDTTYGAVPITTTLGALGTLVGVAVSDVAANAYGWVQRAGTCTSGLRVAASAAVNVQLATTASAGVLDDAVTTGTKNITGIIITATNTATLTATKAGTLNYPVVGTTN